MIMIDSCGTVHCQLAKRTVVTLPWHWWNLYQVKTNNKILAFLFVWNFCMRLFLTGNIVLHHTTCTRLQFAFITPLGQWFPLCVTSNRELKHVASYCAFYYLLSDFFIDKWRHFSLENMISFGFKHSNFHLSLQISL